MLKLSTSSVKKILRTLLFPLFIVCWISALGQTSYYYIQIGQRYLRNQQFMEALPFLNEAIQQFPSSPELYYLRGFAKYSLDDYYGSEKDYSFSLMLFPGNPDVLTNRAIVRTQQHNYSGALEDLTAASHLDSTNSDIYFHFARIKLFMKLYYASMSDCNKALTLNSENENVYILRGSAEMGLERTADAMEDFRKAINMNPLNTYAYIQLGTIYMDQEKPDSALVCFNDAIRVDSINVYAIFSRSLARIKGRDRAGAIQDLGTVIRLSPYNSYAYFNRAILYNELKDQKSAIRDFDFVVRLNPKNIVSFYYRGLLKLEVKDYRGAIADFDKTLDLLPEYPDAYFARSQAKRKINDPTAAEDYKTAFEIAKKNHLSPDSLSAGKKDFLQSLIKLSGDFEEMNTINSKVQNQAIEIQLSPMYRVVTGNSGLDRIDLYDAYKKGVYPENIIRLTRFPELITDSLCNSEIECETFMIDSVEKRPEYYFRRAVAYSGIKKYNPAFADYDSCLVSDPYFILSYFSRATTRYDLIQLINSLNDYQTEITINMNKGEIWEQSHTKELEHTYDMVIRDLDMVLTLDPGFSFAYFNRGFVYCNMGEYHKAEADFTSALQFRDNFPEAYYNRGLVRILLNENSGGCEDLSHAGEMGITDAYRVMKRYCYK